MHTRRVLCTDVRGCLFALLIPFFLFSLNAAGQTPSISFSRDVAPILAQCMQCHGSATLSANLDLRTPEGAKKGGMHGPVIIPGDAEHSHVYRRITAQEDPRMPYNGTPLTDKEIKIIKDWIDSGAQWDKSVDMVALYDSMPKKPANLDRVITAKDREWWAFQRPVRYPVPEVNDPRWSANPIDAFLKKQMDAKGLTPAPMADRRTLIRRAYLDLTGLLPPPEEVEAFVNDKSPDAWGKLIDRLLASEHYGERWARHWLDVARYADSSGYEHDRDFENAWRYRDYVIKAFNEDKPYNQFIIEQLAGDEVDHPTYDSLIATTFNRIGPRVRFREKDNPYYRYEYLDDMIGTTSRGFLGLTVNCARCHDHKFDPIGRMDYYRMMAMFFPFVNYDFPLVPPDQAAAYEKKVKEIQDQIIPLRIEIARIEKPYKEKRFEEMLKSYPEDIQVAVHTPEDKRTPGQKLIAAQFLHGLEDPDAAAAAAFNGAAYRRRLMKLNEEDTAKRQVLLDKIAALEKQMPPPIPIAEGIRDGDYRFTPDGPGDEPLPGKGNRPNWGTGKYIPDPGDNYEPPKVHFGANGQVVADDEKAPVVEPGFIKVLIDPDNPPPVSIKPADGRVTSGRRRALAEWIASEKNPLTARVMINRIWQHHFGKGIVSTPSNYGKLGSPPSNPQLLDWLATEFVRQGWSIKKMHRLIMTSQAYQMASAFYDAEDLRKDPTDTYLWRFPLNRLEGDIIRDIILSASGQLNLQAGGPPFFPSIPKSVREGFRQGKWVLTKEEPSTWRRSIYSYWKRGMKYPMFDVLDEPDVNVTCEARTVTTVPTQALTLMNNEFVLLQAKYFAQRVEQEAGADKAAQVKRAYNIALSRDPTPSELQGNLKFLEKQFAYHQSKKAQQTAESPAAGSDPETAALTDLCDVILNLNEFVYIN